MSELVCPACQIDPDPRGPSACHACRTMHEGATAAAHWPAAARIHAPFDQLLYCYRELEAAYRGKNGYGGTVAEIYAFRLLPQDWLALSGNVPEGLAPMAATELLVLLRQFRVAHPDVEFGIETNRREFPTIDIDRDDAIPPFDWRIHIEVRSSRDRRERAFTAVQAVLRAHGVSYTDVICELLVDAILKASV